MKKILVFVIPFLFYSCSSTNLIQKSSIKTGLEGLVLDENKKPVSNAFVYLYRTATSGLMGPADFMEKTDESGNFFFDVPEGKYYVVVRKRASGLDFGPLRQGDRVANYTKNPVTIAPNEIKKIEITLPSKTHIFQKKIPSGEITISIKLKGDEIRENKFYLLIFEGEKEKKSPDYIQEINENSFTINLPSNRIFSIVVRENMKDKIEKDELYGKYGPFITENSKEIIIELERHK